VIVKSNRETLLMKACVLKMLVLGCVVALWAPSFALGGDKGAGGKRGLGPVEDALAKLELTDQQKKKIEDCKAKFRDFMQAHQDEMKAAKQSDDPAKKRQAAKSMREKRQELIDGIREVLTDEQKKTFDEAMPKPPAHDKGAKTNPGGGTVTQ
jgi:Spy/CpxP family protein refolding chaperone